MQWLPMPERFWAKVAKSTDEGGCWLWTASLYSSGYGSFKLDGRNRRAHQVAYELAVGLIPAGLVICHTYDVRHCVNPAHLWAGTTKENLMDREAKGRGRRLHGADNTEAVLTEADVHDIRRTYRDGELDQTALGERFGITQTMVGMILRYERWAHLVTPDAPPYRADRHRTTPDQILAIRTLAGVMSYARIARLLDMDGVAVYRIATFKRYKDQ